MGTLSVQGRPPPLALRVAYYTPFHFAVDRLERDEPPQPIAALRTCHMTTHRAGRYAFLEGHMTLAQHFIGWGELVAFSPIHRKVKSLSAPPHKPPESRETDDNRSSMLRSNHRPLRNDTRNEKPNERRYARARPLDQQPMVAPITAHYRFTVAAIEKKQNVPRDLTSTRERPRAVALRAAPKRASSQISVLMALTVYTFSHLSSASFCLADAVSLAETTRSYNRSCILFIVRSAASCLPFGFGVRKEKSFRGVCSS